MGESPKLFGFALGGLAGNNAHGAGLLQAAIDCDIHPHMVTCTSGQIYWLFHYLKHLQSGSAAAGDLEHRLREEIKKAAPSGNVNIDLALLAFRGRKGVFRLTHFREYPWDVLKNSFAATIDTWQQGWKASYVKEFLKVWPARTVKSLLEPSFFQEVSDTFNNETRMGIAFNSYDPQQGMEFVHLNEKAKELLDRKAGNQSSYRHRTLYKDIKPEYVRDGLWIYEYGFGENSSMVDGAYYRQIMLSELAKASVETIVIARPINKKWIGELPRTFVSREDLKTEVSFNGLYQGERDKIELINRMVKDKVFTKKAREKRTYNSVDLVELEIDSQESFFDYVFEDMDVFHRRKHVGKLSCGSWQISILPVPNCGHQPKLARSSTACDFTSSLPNLDDAPVHLTGCIAIGMHSVPD